jgi:hypothetical protein
MYNGVRMKAANPFPSVSLLLPDDVLENHDDRVSSYWRNGDTCLLICHYVLDHGYVPPAEFLRALKEYFPQNR